MKVIHTHDWGLVDIVYSPDEGIWYGQRADGSVTAGSFETAEDTVSALTESCEWEDGSNVRP